MPRFRAAASLWCILLHSGCDGALRPVGPRGELPLGTEAVARLRGTVDLLAGTLTFDVEPRTVSEAGGIPLSASVYGDQGVTVRIFNSPVAVTNGPTPGKKRYTAMVGLRNLQSFPIGDEQGGSVPVDTSGIFVFVNGGPTPIGSSSPCSPACTVSVANAHGRMAFNAPNQPYWYWRDRLTASGGARDTTLSRLSWSFEADTQVTGFTFDVLVAAAWPAPHETRWKTEYHGDSLPHTATEPRWLRTATLGTESVQIVPSSISLVSVVTPRNGSQYFMRRDSIGSETLAYMEAVVRTDIDISRPEISFGLDDGVRFVAVGLSGSRVGFVDNAFGFIGTSVATTTIALQTYRLRKFGADSVQLLINGSRVTSRLYTGFSPSYSFGYTFFGFGGPGNGSPPASRYGNASSWDYVVYEIGVTQP